MASTTVDELLNGNVGNIIVQHVISPIRTVVLQAFFQEYDVEELEGDEDEEEDDHMGAPKVKVYWVVRLYTRQEGHKLRLDEMEIPIDELRDEELEGIVAASAKTLPGENEPFRPRVKLDLTWDGQDKGISIKSGLGSLTIVVNMGEKGVIEGFEPVEMDPDTLNLELMDLTLELMARLMKKQERNQASALPSGGGNATSRKKSSKFVDMDERLSEAEHKLNLLKTRLKSKKVLDQEERRRLVALLKGERQVAEGQIKSNSAAEPMQVAPDSEPSQEIVTAAQQAFIEE